MAEHHPLNTAGQVGRPAHLVNGVAADPLDDSAFLWCQVPVPAELLQHGHRELRIAVGQLRALRVRSEEHTSELQSLMRISYAVFCLKKKKHKNIKYNHHTNNHMR